jgi:hypothetical protein
VYVKFGELVEANRALVFPGRSPEAARTVKDIEGRGVILEKIFLGDPGYNTIDRVFLRKL